MAKLTRYNSFKDLKLDVKSANEISFQSKETYRKMVDFIRLLRRKLVEKKELQKNNLKIS
jgi:hypothetical protein